jgi:predicted secreted protein
MPKRAVFAFVGGALLLSVAPGLVGASPVAAQPVAALSAVRAAEHAGQDRLVFQFAGPLPRVRSVAWVSEMVEDPSGRPLQLGGRAFLRVVFRPATAHTTSGVPTYARALPTLFDLPALRSLKEAGDFEDVLSFGVGLWQKTSLHVFTLASPSRLVIDMAVPPGGPGRLDEIDNGRLVYLSQGQKVSVALRTCTDCGYSWRVATAPDRNIVRILSATVVPLPHPSGIVGFPSESRWVLQATGPGLTILRLYELRPGRPASPVGRYRLRFTVTGGRRPAG